MKKKKMLGFLFCLFVMNSFGQVPLQWDTAKTELITKLHSINNEIENRWDTQPYNTNFAGNLLLANSNRGYSLFTHDPINYPQTIPAYQNLLFNAIDSMLIALDSLGLKAIDLTVQYPMLVTSFNHSSDYLNFYKVVAQKIKQKGFKLIIGCQAAFVDSVFGEENMVNDITTHYFNPDNNILTNDTLNVLRFREEKLQMLQTIVDSIQPDYLTLEMEPETQHTNLFGLIDYSVDSTLSLINYFTSNLNITNETLIGAGAGTWDDVEFFKQIASTDIDYIDYHIYPVNYNFVDNLVFTIDSLANVYNKKLIIGESWCFKITDSEMANVTNWTNTWATVYSRDVFDYWVEVDTLFVKSMILLSQQSKIELVNFFWTNVLFGQLTYNPATHGAMSPGQILNSGQTYGYQQMYDLQLTPIGEYVKMSLASFNTATHTKGNTIQNIDFQIYPNPTKGILYIKPPSTDNFSLSVYDVAGNKILSDENIYQLDLSTFPTGIYALVVNQNGLVLQGKIVKE